MNTETREKIKHFIILYQRAFPGETPTVREVMKYVNVASPSVVHYHIKQLREEGFLDDSSTKITMMRTALITKEQAELFGISWGDLMVEKTNARMNLEREFNYDYDC